MYSKTFILFSKIIYDEGKKIGNLNLTKIYQEFIVGAAYTQTKKQLLPNMEPFLSLIPYCPQNPAEYNGTLVSNAVTVINKIHLHLSFL